LAAFNDSTLCLFNSTRPDLGPTASFRGHDAPSFYVKVAMSPDGRHVISGSTDSKVYIWQTDRPQDPPYRMEGHTGEVTGVDWSSCHEDKVASVSDDGTMRIWSVRRRETPQHRRTPLPPRGANRYGVPAAAPAAAAAAAAAAPVPLAVDVAMLEGAPAEAPPPPAVVPERVVLAAAGAAVLNAPDAGGAEKAATLLVRTMTSYFPMLVESEGGGGAEAAAAAGAAAGEAAACGLGRAAYRSRQSTSEGAPGGRIHLSLAKPPKPKSRRK